MTQLVRFVNVLSGFAGAPGVNVLHFSPGISAGDPDSVAQWAYEEQWAMYDALSSYLAPEVTVSVDLTPSVIDSETGELTGVASIVDPNEDIGSTGTSNVAPRGVAALVRFQSDIFRNGRRLQGRMFFGPYSDDGLDSIGGVPTVAQNTIVDAFTAMSSGTGPRLAVYSRPKPIKVGGVTTGYTVGYYGDVVTVNVPHRASYLRERNA